MFLDIGGDRIPSVVCRALVLVDSFWSGSGVPPCLVVVKSQGLSSAAATACDAFGSIQEPALWWRECAMPSQSARQLKKTRRLCSSEAPSSKDRAA